MDTLYESFFNLPAVKAALPPDGPAQAAQEPPKRLVGFEKVMLAPGESKEVTIAVDPEYLSIFDEGTNAWKMVPGEYTFAAGGSSADLPLKQTVQMGGGGQ